MGRKSGFLIEHTYVRFVISGHSGPYHVNGRFRLRTR